MVSCIYRFLGMLLIVQPAFIDVNYYYITPIVFCIFFACVAISVRSLSKTEANYTIAFYFTLLCTLLGLGTIFFNDWIMPTFIDFVLFFVTWFMWKCSQFIIDSKL